MAKNMFMATIAMSGVCASPPALGGYDMVAYHKLGSATMGSSEHTYTFVTEDCNTGNGVTCVPRFHTDFHFVSKENLEAFKKDPWRYAPRYGGF